MVFVSNTCHCRLQTNPQRSRWVERLEHLSPWLASGALSARTVAHAIFRYEREHVANDSTYWLYFELLWREFFHWRAVIDGQSLFRQGGRSGRRLLATLSHVTLHDGAPATPTILWSMH